MKIKMSASRRLFVIFNYIFLTLLSLVFVLPMLSIVSTSLVSQAEIQERGNLFLFPRKIDYSAYKILLNKDSIVWNAYGITLFRVAVGTLIQMTVTCMLAYALSKKKLPFRGIITGFVLVPMFISGGLVPTYLLIKQLGLIDSLWVLVIPNAMSIYNMLLLRNFFMSIPITLEESAVLDGATPLRTLWSIIKLVSPIIRIAELGGADFVALFSTDDGHTFGNPVRLNRDNGCYYIMNQRIMRTHSGRIIVPVGWVPNELLEKEHETVGYSGCFYSDDEGQSWKESKWVEGKTVDQLCEPIIVQGSDKRLFMYMRTGKGYLYYSVSDDDGVVWSTEERSELRSPCAPFCIQYDKYENRFLAVWCNSFPGPVIQCPRSPICLAQSYDGMHWKMICELDNNPDRSYGYPMIKAYKEEILITYYENPTRKFNFRIHSLKCKIFDRKELLSK